MADAWHELGREQHETGFACKIRQRLVHGAVGVPILKRALILHRRSPISRPRHGRRRLPIELHDWSSLAPCAGAVSIAPAASTARPPWRNRRATWREEGI